MALNQQFASQNSRKLPLAFGYVFCSGDNDLNTTAQDGSLYARFLLGEGEWDGPESLNTFPLAATQNNSISPSNNHIWSNPLHNGDVLNPTNPASAKTSYTTYMHFHSGAYTPIGMAIPTPDPVTGLIAPNTSQSYGPDQGYDIWYQNFPTVMAPQSLSGIAYAIWGAPSPAEAYQTWLNWPPPQGAQSYGSYLSSIYQQPTITGMAVWRALRCRIFDGNGNVIAYQFTCNPAWHKVEAILRRKIKPQQPGVAGLTDAEKACFNWDSICTLAARNDYILPNGAPRFVGNYLFASDTTLAQIMETMCRVDRSFQRIDDGKITLQGDDARASVFVASAKHLVPGSLKLDKKDVSKAPNQFVPTYRDLEIPAVAQVQSGVSYGAFYIGSKGWVLGYRAITSTTPSPFETGSYFRLGGCSDPSWDGCYATYVPDESGDPYPKRSASPNTTYAQMSTAAGTPIGVITGGYLGSDDARFSQRAPTGVQHRSAQKMVPRQAPGLTVQPKIIRVNYDCGNSTFDQTNRLMKFERDRSLGTDIGAGWMAPIAGTVSLWYECVDANGALLPQQAKSHNVITLDDWLFPEGPGDYEIMEIQIREASGDTPKMFDLTLHAYNRNAYTDVSDPPGSYYMSVPNSSLTLTGFTPVANAAFVLNATLAVTDDGDGVDIAIPDLLIWIMGKVAPTAYPAFDVLGVPVNTPVCLYVDDPAGDGVNATYGWLAGTSLLSTTVTAAQSRGYSYFLQSSGPGSEAAGNMVTVYYSDSTQAGPDQALVNAFNSGPLFVNCSFTGGPQTQGPYNDVRVTSVGLASPPGQPRQFYYFTFEVPTSASIFYAGSGHPGYTANYQIVNSGTTSLPPGRMLVYSGTFTQI